MRKSGFDSRWDRMKKLVFVTQNKYKLEDARRLLPEFEIAHVDFDVP